MSFNQILEHKFVKILFILFVVIWLCLWVFNIPPNLDSASSGPDEKLRMLVPMYIYQHQELPSGYDNEVIYTTGNWSYAFYPQMLGAVVSAIFMGIASTVSDTGDALVYGARLASVLFGTLTVCVLGLTVRKLLTGRKYANLYAYIAMILLLFWPQFAFLSSYINNDIVALAGASIIIYACALGLKDGWKIKRTIILGVGISVCLLGYNNSYGFVLFGGVFFLITVIQQFKGLNKRRLVMLLSIAVIVPLTTAGPFFVRNAVVYNGDFLGLSTFKNRTTQWEQDNNQRVQTSYVQAGRGDVVDLLRDRVYWKEQQDSLIGKFGYMTITPNSGLYITYKATIITGIVGFLLYLISIIKTLKMSRLKKELFFGLFLIAASLTTLSLSIYYSLMIDIQPQGRYIVYLLVPLLIISVLGTKYLVDRFIPNKLKKYTIVFLLIYVVNTLFIFSKYILPL